MKIILTFLVGIVITGQCFAKCASSGIQTYPQNRLIKQNSLIMIEGFATSQKIINSLNQDYPVYLESKGHKVILNVTSIYKGQFQLTQAILTPEEKLLSGRTYTLMIDNLDKHQKTLLTRWNSITNEREPIKWEVQGGTDTESPVLTNQPELLNKIKVRYGCGPAIYADFKININDESDVLIKTELVDLESGESTCYLLSLGDTATLSVGHGMCSGAFVYKENGKYQVRFSPVDICGNETEKWTSWIEFDSPFEGH